MAKRIPPWMEAVSVSNELVYQYLVPGRNTTDVLEADRERLRVLQQPDLINSQLFQLYAEMEEEQDRGPEWDGLVELEEGDNSTSSSNAEETNSRRRELRRRSAEFRRTMLYEENAPFPHPQTPTTDGWQIHCECASHLLFSSFYTFPRTHCYWFQSVVSNVFPSHKLRGGIFFLNIDIKCASTIDHTHTQLRSRNIANSFFLQFLVFCEAGCIYETYWFNTERRRIRVINITWCTVQENNFVAVFVLS